MNEYPLHWCVFENEPAKLKENLTGIPKDEIDRKDLRGKTPLELAVFLNKIECAKILVEHGADCGVITKAGWNLVQEAVSSGNSDMVKLILSYRDYQRENARSNGIPELLKKLKQAPDFYVEMKWEFTSWIPLVSKACPSDVYKIYKSGSNVRIDTTLIGFNGTTWERGNRSFIFQADNKGTATIIEIDHLLKTYHIDKLIAIDSSESSSDPSADMIYEPNESIVFSKLKSPNIVTFLDIEKIEFERNRSGIWGWRSDKNESINGYECKVYSANNLQLVTKTRVEHLNAERANAFLNELAENENMSQNNQHNGNIPSFLTNFFQGNEQHIKIKKADNPLTSLEYFQKQIPLDYYLKGSVRNIDETRKIQTFNANLSLCDGYPLSLHEQVIPIVDLMALNNSHFKKLKEFITLQLPSGFPIKVEIPLYRVITAKVTFGNIHALDQHVDHVTTIKHDSTKTPSAMIKTNKDNAKNFEDFECTSDTKFLLDSEDSNSPQKPISAFQASSSMCMVDESVFKIPIGYRCTNMHYSGVESNFFDNERQAGVAAKPNLEPRQNQFHSQIDEDDVLLQLAIQQSLSYNGSESSEFAENLSNSRLIEDAQIFSSTISPIRDSRGSTQSLQEYHERRNNLAFLQNDENMLLQRALEESLMLSNPKNNEPVAQAEVEAGVYEDDPIIKALEWSEREAEEMRVRERQEEDDLEKILALSLIEK